uniref:Uncharacterized protein n=1 Tax=mine drainage metagenome TaxID=410659 RepID=E6QK77_9ZZZZ
MLAARMVPRALHRAVRQMIDSDTTTTFGPGWKTLPAGSVFFELFASEHLENRRVLQRICECWASTERPGKRHE